MNILRTVIAALILVSGPLRADEMPVIRAAVLKIGTVNWELATITENGLDLKHGFRLEVMPFADNGGTRIAVEGGRADMAVADWIWVARQRAAGKGYVFVPYSKAVGGVVVPGDSDAETLADLAGGKIGIAGGPLDKSLADSQGLCAADRLRSGGGDGTGLRRAAADLQIRAAVETMRVRSTTGISSPR